MRAFAARGDDIALIARGEDGLDAAAKEVDAAGGRAVVLRPDVADAGAIEDAATTVERELGPIDVWVHNAMVSVLSPVTALTAAKVRRVTEVSYLDYVDGPLAALARMRPRDRGTIVHVGSARASGEPPFLARAVK